MSRLSRRLIAAAAAMVVIGVLAVAGTLIRYLYIRSGGTPSSLPGMLFINQVQPVPGQLFGSGGHLRGVLAWLVGTIVMCAIVGALALVGSVRGRLSTFLGVWLGVALGGAIGATVSAPLFLSQLYGTMNVRLEQQIPMTVNISHAGAAWGLSIGWLAGLVAVLVLGRAGAREQPRPATDSERWRSTPG